MSRRVAHPETAPERIAVAYCVRCGEFGAVERPERKHLLTKVPCSNCPGHVGLVVMPYNRAIPSPLRRAAKMAARAR